MEPSTDPVPTARDSAARLAMALYNLRRAYHARVRALLPALPPEGIEHAEARAQQLAVRRAVHDLLVEDGRGHDALLHRLVDLGLLPARALEPWLREDHAASVEPASHAGEGDSR